MILNNNKLIIYLNYLLIIICFVLKLFDVLITFKVIRNGGVELNPLGFNFVTVFLGFMVIIPLLFINRIFTDKIISYLVSIGSISVITMLTVVIRQGVLLL